MTTRRVRAHRVETSHPSLMQPWRSVLWRIGVCLALGAAPASIVAQVGQPAWNSSTTADASSGPAADQAARRVSGTVSDPQGARVAAARILATAGGRRVDTQTGADGAFSLVLAPGSYTIRVEAPGFTMFERQVVVTTDGDVSLDVVMAVGTLSDAVTVQGTGAPTRTITGTRTDTPLIEVPQAVSVITAEQIDAQAAQTLEEVVRYTAGVRAEMYGPDNRGDWFTLRGGSEGSTVLDGLRLPLSGWWGNVRNEPYGFDQVEVLRGPSSVMFGQNGPGGVVNLVSKLPQPTPRREFAVQFGSHGHKQLATDLGGRLTADGRLLYRMVALAQDSGTQVQHASEERQYLAPSLEWRPGSTTALTAFGQYQRDESDNTVGFFPREGTIFPAPSGPIPDDTFIGEPDWDSYGGRRWRAGYRLEQRIGRAWTLRHDLRHENVDGHVRGMYAAFWEDGLLEDGRSVNRLWYASRSDTRIDNTSVLLEGRFGTGALRHTLLFGTDALWVRDVTSDVEGEATPLDVYTPTYGTFPLPPLEFAAVAPTRTRQVGVVVQDQVKIADRWSALVGVRRDYARSANADLPETATDDAAWSSRAGLVYLGHGGVAPYVSYSQSFEAVGGTDIHGSPYKAKRGGQVEGGLKWQPANGRQTLAAAVYRLQEKNRLTADPENPLNQVQRGEVTVRGLELEATARVPALDLTANYTYTDARVTASSDPNDAYLGKRLFSIPTHSAAAWAVHHLSVPWLRGVSAGAGVRYVGETWDGTDTLATPDTTLVDARAAFDAGRWRVAVNASNLFDKRYIATCLDRGDCWFGNRRKVFVSLTVRP